MKSATLTPPALSRPQADGWSEPVQFPEIDPPMFPVGVFPEWLRSYATEMATALQVPVDLMAVLGLGVTAATCAKRVTVTVRKGWTEPVNLYLAPTLFSGEGKSPAFRAATKPIRDYEARQESEILDEIGEARLRQSLLQAQRRQLIRETLKQSAEAAEATSKVHDVDKELRALVVPPAPRLVIDDVTTAKLSVIMQENGERIAV